MARARVPDAALGVKNTLRAVRDVREADGLVMVRVVVAHVDGGALVAADARAAAAARLVADAHLLRVVAPEVGDAVLDGALVGVVVARDAADDFVLGGRSVLSAGSIVQFLRVEVTY